MPQSTWIKTTGTTDWNTVAAWSGGVPNNADALIAAAGTYTANISVLDNITVHNITLNAANAKLALNGTLTLGATLLVKSGTLLLQSSGILQGGTLQNTGGTIIGNSATLNAVTIRGPLPTGTIDVRSGLTVLSAAGAPVTTLDLRTTTLGVLDSETLGPITAAANALIAAGSGITLTLADTLTTAGNTELQDLWGGILGVDINNGATLVTAGLIAATNTLNIDVNTWLNTGTLNLAAAATIDAHIFFAGNQAVANNAGTILLAPGGRLAFTTGVPFTNTGTIEATGGTGIVTSLASNAPAVALTNFTAQTLTGGSYVADPGATLTLVLGDVIATDAATITLAGSINAVTYINDAQTHQTIPQTLSLESTLATITPGGILNISGRAYTATQTLTDLGQITLANTSFTAPLSIDSFGTLTGSGALSQPTTNNGLIDASGGLLAIAALSGAGLLQIEPLATLELTTATLTANFNLIGGTLLLDTPTAYTGTINAFAPNDTIILHNTDAASASIDNTTIDVTLTAGGTLSYATSALAPNNGVTLTTDGLGNTLLTLIAPPITGGGCFLTGTRILTQSGEIPVEQLRIGVRIPTLRGKSLARITWIGRRTLDAARHPAPHDVLPVRIQAHAFAPNTPARDLYLSPDHAIHAAGALIPIRYLLNGASVTQIQATNLTYWHIELDCHDLLLSEGLATETYLDTGNRSDFSNTPGPSPLHPNFALGIWANNACAPLATTGAPVAATRRALLAQARTLGHHRTTNPALTLLADGTPLDIAANGHHRAAAIPPGTRTLTVASRSFRPAHTDPAGIDTRTLGIALRCLRLNGQPTSLDDPRLLDGWHPPEPSLRWTTGAATIDARHIEIIEFEIALPGTYWSKQATATHVPAEAPYR